MKHAALLELQLKHPFYTDGRCLDLAIEPSAATARLLDRCRWLLRASPGALRIVTPLDAAGHPLLSLPAGASLRFELRITNDDFALFTDLSAIRDTPSPCFSNARRPAGATGELALGSRTTTDPTTGETVPASQAPGVLAEIEIELVLHPGAGGGSALTTAAFQVTLRARQWRWAYYCVTDLAAGELSVVDASPSGTPDALSFSDANRTTLDEHPDPSDPIAAQLAIRHPGLHRVRFLSDQTVACREAPRQLLELRLDGQRVWRPLPNPSLRSFTRRAPPPEELLFQIIEYRTRPFSTP